MTPAPVSPHPAGRRVRPRRPRPLSLSARVGVWIGVFGWYLGLLVATASNWSGFLVPLAGGLAVSVVAGLVFEWVLRRAPRFLPGAAAGLCLAVGLIGTWHALVVQPALLADAAVAARLAALEAEFRFPFPLAIALLVAGVVLFVLAFRPPPRAGPSTASRAPSSGPRPR